MASKVILPSNVPIADKNGNPSSFFVRQLTQLLKEKQDVADATAAAQAAADAAQATADAAVPSDALLAQLITSLGGDPNQDKIVFWDDSAGTFKLLSIGSNLSITDTTIDATGGGGGGTGRTLISDQILAANSTTVTFSSIAGSYSDLFLEFEARRSDSTSDLEFYLQFNGDTGSNYQYYVENRTGNANIASDTKLRCGTAGGSSLTAGIYATGQLTIYNYTRTDRYKHTTSPFSWFPQLTVSDKVIGAWRSNSPITSIVLLGTGGFTFAAGSRFRLYGL